MDTRAQPATLIADYCYTKGVSLKHHRPEDSRLAAACLIAKMRSMAIRDVVASWAPLIFLPHTTSTPRV